MHCLETPLINNNDRVPKTVEQSKMKKDEDFRKELRR